jgi:SHS2 domain-containing protein
MSKHWQVFEHTADVGIAAKADTMGELFEALGDGLSGIICRRDRVDSQDTREIHIAAEDREALAMDFLSEVLNIIQSDGFLVGYVRVDAISDTDVRAELIGEPYDQARHELHTEVKAITYHLLKIAQEEGRWVGRVILDL